MMNDGFSYDENAGLDKTVKFGIEWYGRAHYSMTSSLLYIYLKNPEFGEFIISQRAFDKINEADYYKVLSLIFEHKFTKNIYSITLAEEKHELQWRDDNYVSLSLDEFFNCFPSDFIEIQHRALMNLYNQCSEYGQEINCHNSYVFFAKNDSELLFFLESMKQKGWLDIDIRKMMDGGFGIANTPKITVEGWLEIEKTINSNRKKQVFIAMKFKNMDSVYDAVYKAIWDATFFPLRIDKKEHINQISTEIQYEISQSGLVVADATGQNQGVYFEAGYAMGLNIPVIWTCNVKEVDEIHFDTRQYNTILWENENDLCERLKKRIIAIMGLQNESS
jgi:nucleoside 2-deoxyribosyltransferase